MIIMIIITTEMTIIMMTVITIVRIRRRIVIMMMMIEIMMTVKVAQKNVQAALFLSHSCSFSFIPISTIILTIHKAKENNT
jgi:hypothetical protein